MKWLRWCDHIQEITSVGRQCIHTKYMHTKYMYTK